MISSFNINISTEKKKNVKWKIYEIDMFHSLFNVYSIEIYEKGKIVWFRIKKNYANIQNSVMCHIHHNEKYTLYGNQRCHCDLGLATNISSNILVNP